MRLENCPFCGSKPRMFTSSYTDNGESLVWYQCGNAECPAVIATRECAHSPRQANELWNDMVKGCMFRMWQKMEGEKDDD